MCSRLSHSDAQNTLFRASATSGNNVGISQTTSASRDLKKGMAKSTATSTTMAGGFSDEDDSVEKAVILNSPLKGEKRLSSTVSWSSYLCLISQSTR